VEGLREPPRDLRVVASHIDLEDVSGRVLFPTSVQGPWMPFSRFAETNATGSYSTESHSHREEEVMVFVLDGRVHHEDEAGHVVVLEAGTVLLLTARQETRHNVSAEPPSRARWLSLVVRCRSSRTGPPYRVQVAPGTRPPPLERDGAERNLVGHDSPVMSSSGLECRHIELAPGARCVCPIGPDRRGLAYVYDGSGAIEGLLVDAGAGVLFDGAREVNFESKSNTRILVASAPARGPMVPPDDE
jgi:redox-sensitive bicupin YhaK (pirin superfamily)